MFFRILQKSPVFAVDRAKLLCRTVDRFAGFQHRQCFVRLFCGDRFVCPVGDDHRSQRSRHRQIDAIIAGMADTESRKEAINFTAPYHETVYALMVNAGTQYENATSLADFNGASVLGQKDTALDWTIDQIEGVSAACNVLPQNMRAVINFRLNEGDSIDSVMEHCRTAVNNPKVHLRFLQANDPSATARSDGYGYHKLCEAMNQFFPEVVFVPSMSVGATDAHQYERICDTCLRCSPFLTEPEDVRTGMHGTNERIPIRSYIQGIRVLIRLMELVNVNP